MKLSKRLSAVASLVDGKKVIDVGCDHGYLSIYLTQLGLKCLATDISKKCLLKAIDNFNKFNLNIDYMITDGINGIDIKQFDTIIISGMGTHTILKILKDKHLPDTLVISSNNCIDFLRCEIVKLGFYIDDEVYIKDGRQKYIIIRFKKGQKHYNEFDYLIGPILKYNQEYLNDCILEYQNIIDKIENIHNDKRVYYGNLIKKIKELSK